MMRITRTAGWIVLIAVLFLLAWFVRSELWASSPPQADAQTPTESYLAPQVSEQVAAQYPPPFRPTEAIYVAPTEDQIPTIASYPGPFPSSTPEPTYTLVPGPTSTPFPLPVPPKDASGILTYLTYGDKSSTVINKRSMDSQGNPGAQVDTKQVDVIGPPENPINVDFTKQFINYATNTQNAVLYFRTSEYFRPNLLDITTGKLQSFPALDISDVYEWYSDGLNLLINHSDSVLFKDNVL